MVYQVTTHYLTHNECYRVCIISTVGVGWSLGLEAVNEAAMFSLLCVPGSDRHLEVT